MAQRFSRIINEPVERITESIPTIDTNHAQIHEGNGFSLTGSLTVATATVGAIQIYVPGNDYATVTIDMTNALSDLTYTAVDYGTAGNSITVTHVDPSGNDQPLAVNVDGTDITVSLATGPAGAITSTAAEVKAAVNVHADASLLVLCEDEGVGSGIVNAEAVTSLAGGAFKTYVHFQTAGISTDAGPSSVSLLEDYVMDSTALGSASALTPINHNRIAKTASTLTLLGSAGPVTATDDGDNITLSTLVLAGLSVGVQHVGSEASQPQEWVLNPQTNYLIVFSNGDTGNITFAYNLFWYEEDGIVT